MTLIGMNLAASYAATNSKNELVKNFIDASPKGSEAKAEGVAATPKEVFMLAYLCSCFLKGKRFKKISATQAMMSAGLDIRRVFKELEYIDGESESIKKEPDQFAAGNRENLIMDMLIRNQS